MNVRQCLTSLYRAVASSWRGGTAEAQPIHQAARRSLSGSDRPPLPPPPSHCCGSGCPKCVWLRHAEELTRYYKDAHKASEEVLAQIEDPVIKAFIQLELKKGSKITATMPKRKQQTDGEAIQEEAPVTSKKKRVSFVLDDNRDDDSHDPAVDATLTNRRSKKKKGKRKKNKTAAVMPPLSSTPVSRRDDALRYLHQWSTDRTNWSFKKRQQLWLVQNVYNKTQVDRTSFKQLMLYLEELKGAQRSRLVEQAMQMVEQYSPRQEAEEQDIGQTPAADKVLRYQYKRAVELLRVLA